MPRTPWERLFAAAARVRDSAHAPYSQFRVGAAFYTASKDIIVGCNVENATYGLTVCAERNAMGRTVAERQTVVAVAIVTQAKAPTPPCGMCRQVLAEFCPPTVPVRSRTVAGLEAQYTVGRLLPHAFTSAWLTSRRLGRLR